MTDTTHARAALPGLVRAVLDEPLNGGRCAALADALEEAGDPRAAQARRHLRDGCLCRPHTLLLEMPTCPVCGSSEMLSGEVWPVCRAGWQTHGEGCCWSRSTISDLLPPLADLAR